MRPAAPTYASAPGRPGGLAAGSVASGKARSSVSLLLGSQRGAGAENTAQACPRGAPRVSPQLGATSRPAATSPQARAPCREAAGSALHSPLTLPVHSSAHMRSERNKAPRGSLFAVTHSGQRRRSGRGSRTEAGARRDRPARSPPHPHRDTPRTQLLCTPNTGKQQTRVPARASGQVSSALESGAPCAGCCLCGLCSLSLCISTAAGRPRRPSPQCRAAVMPPRVGLAC